VGAGTLSRTIKSLRSCSFRLSNSAPVSDRSPYDSCSLSSPWKRQTLASSNPIESCLSTVERVARNVKRWRAGDHGLRRTATGLLEAEKKFRKVKGFRELEVLQRKLNPSCCPTLIMSPFVLDRNVSLIQPPKGGWIEANRGESRGTAASGSVGAGAQRRITCDGCEPDAGSELPIGEAVVETVSGGRSGGAEASERGTSFQSRLSEKVSQSTSKKQEKQISEKGTFLTS
jgi:hypothetical protein